MSPTAATKTGNKHSTPSSERRKTAAAGSGLPAQRHSADTNLAAHPNVDGDSRNRERQKTLLLVLNQNGRNPIWFRADESTEQIGRLLDVEEFDWDTRRYGYRTRNSGIGLEQNQRGIPFAQLVSRRACLCL
ncbi:protein of unknown function (plasmid) [Agreia sp. COWG]|nr:protein of unknown function [Agreia sp. COWG]